MKSIIQILIFVLISLQSGAQINVLVYFDKTQNDSSFVYNSIGALRKSCPEIELKISSNSNHFTLNNLENFNTVFFFNSSAYNLSLQESNALISFFEAGGGFIGTGNALKEKYSWKWYSNQLGTILSNRKRTFQELSIITNKQIGKTELLPYWKLKDSLIVELLAPKNAKVLLVDLKNNPISWMFKTRLGNKSFYTSLGLNNDVWSDFNFLHHLKSGIEEVSPTKIVLNNATEFPKLDFFKLDIYQDSLDKPVSFINIDKTKILLINKMGEVGLRYLDSGKYKLLGQKEELRRTIKIKKDPDFSTNGTLFCFLGVDKKANQILQLNLNADSLRISNEFIETENTELFKTKIKQDTSSKRLFGLPRYFSNKIFSLTNKNTLEIESVNASGEQINIENLEVLNSEMDIIDFDFDDDNILYLLNSRNILRLRYSEIGFPSFFIPGYNQEKKGFIKLFTESEFSPNSKNRIEWFVNNQKVSNDLTFDYQVKKSGLHKIKFVQYFNDVVVKEQYFQVIGKLLKK